MGQTVGTGSGMEKCLLNCTPVCHEELVDEPWHDEERRGVVERLQEAPQTAMRDEQLDVRVAKDVLFESNVGMQFG